MDEPSIDPSAGSEVNVLQLCERSSLLALLYRIWAVASTLPLL